MILTPEDIIYRVDEKGFVFYSKIKTYPKTQIMTEDGMSKEKTVRIQEISLFVNGEFSRKIGFNISDGDLSFPTLLERGIQPLIKDYEKSIS